MISVFLLYNYLLELTREASFFMDVCSFMDNDFEIFSMKNSTKHK